MTPKLILPLVAVLAGAIGLTAGYVLKPGVPAAATETETTPSSLPSAFIKLPNQFIIPLLEKDQISGMVILSISLEVAETASENVFQNEPHLRDNLLQALFDYANTGGFRGNFTNADALAQLRRQLLEVGKHILGAQLRNVLITDIMRQDS